MSSAKFDLALWTAFNWVEERFHLAFAPPNAEGLVVPLFLLQRLDCLLKPTKAKVLDLAKRMGPGAEAPDLLSHAAGLPFYHTSPLTLGRMADAQPGDCSGRLGKYLEAFGPNVRRILTPLDVVGIIGRFEEVADMRPLVQQVAQADLSRAAVSTERMSRVMDEVFRRIASLPSDRPDSHPSLEKARQAMDELLALEAEVPPT